MERAIEMQRETPLTEDDLAFIKQGPSNALELTGMLIDRMRPRWLMGWRDITNATNERTVIASVMPVYGAGNKIPLMSFADLTAREASSLLATLSSLPLDYAARQKIGGTTMNYFIYKQLPVLGRAQFSAQDHDFISLRVLELTYTSHAMRLWAEDLGHVGAPFAFDPDRRALLRAELDAFFAKKYGLMRDELRYILDPHDIKGPDYPSETFRGLKTKECNQLNEYRTQRLVLEAFDRMTGG